MTDNQCSNLIKKIEDVEVEIMKDLSLDYHQLSKIASAAKFLKLNIKEAAMISKEVVR